MSKLISTVLALLMLGGFAFAQQNVVVPYILKAPAPITVDGNLDEWAFAFPLNHNPYCMSDSGRFRGAGWVPSTFEDCSGTLYMMYDDDYLYVAASVMDDAPGHFSDQSWAADAIEFYICNIPMGDALYPPVPATGAWPNDATSGDYAVQITIAFDASLDSVWVHEWYGVAADLISENTQVVYQLWPNEDGYNIEGKIYLPDLDNASTGNSLSFTPGTRIPMTWSLYDMDESENANDFSGFAYTPKGYAGWMGVGPGWQSCDVMETPRGFDWEDMSTFNFASPYIKRAVEPITVDGNLYEWNWCFPLEHSRSVMTDSGRFVANNWLPVSDTDCKGTIMMMYDDDYLYIAGSVMDDAPGHFSDQSWAADAIEYYICNIDMGSAMHPEVPVVGAWPNDATSGAYAVQITNAYDASLDSVWVHEWYGVAADLISANTQVVYQLWLNEDGYNMEGKIYLPDLDNASTGNSLAFNVGQRYPMTWSLYDMDESENANDFSGFAYTPKGFAGWMGVGPGWQYADVKDISVVEYIDYAFSHGGFPPLAIDDQDNPVVSGYRLDQNYPNPFNPTTNISFSLDRTSRISLMVYDVTGQLVKTVINNVTFTAGAHVTTIDMSNLSSGIYFTVLNNGKSSLQKKMMLIK